MRKARSFLLVMGAILCVPAVTGCQKLANPGSAASLSASAPRSAPGFEIRYNATLALARRGSELARERLDVLGEMLDEQQQLANFRTRLKDGQEVPDETAARSTVISALKAVAELYRKRPELDLRELYPAIDKLTDSANVAVRAEAERTRIALGKSE